VNTATNVRLEDSIDDDDRKIGAIDPCDVCAHKDFVAVDKRCSSCGLRGRRFFEVLHANKELSA